MKVVTPEGYTFVTKFQEDNSHKVLRSVDFFSIKFDEIFFDTVCWVAMFLILTFIQIYNILCGSLGRRAKLGQIQGGLQRAIQDLTKGGCNIFFTFHVLKIELFKVFTLSD